MQHSKKRTFYWFLVCKKTLKEIGIIAVWTGIVVGGIGALLGWKFGLTKKEELPELFIIIVASTIAGFVLEFVFRLLFVTPAKMYQDVEDKKEEAESKLKNSQSDQPKPLEINTVPIEYDANPLILLPAGGPFKANGPATSASCKIKVSNSNQGIDNVVLSILKIEPPMPTVEGTATTAHFDLSIVDFPLLGFHAPPRSLTQNESGQFCIFTAIRTPQAICVQFVGENNTLTSGSFIPGPEHIITILAKASGVPQKEERFKATFSLDPTKPTFILEKLHFGLVIHSASWFVWDDENDRISAEKDVTQIIVTRDLIDGKLEVLCETSKLGDPCHDREKILKIDYSFNGKKMQKSFPEHSMARLP